ncbi:MAG: hypothetical protein AB2693_17200 [Candidatus Thiodiazotropha sp.]
MADQSIGDIESLYRQIVDLKKQNEILRMESEITGFEKELDEYAGQMQVSTPKPVKAEQSLDPKQVKLDIPAGGPGDTRKADAKSEELNIPDNMTRTGL